MYIWIDTAANLFFSFLCVCAVYSTKTYIQCSVTYKVKPFPNLSLAAITFCDHLCSNACMQLPNTVLMTCFHELCLI